MQTEIDTDTDINTDSMTKELPTKWNTPDHGCKL